LNANIKKVLIVHGDDDDCKKLRDHLEKKGIEVLITPELFTGLNQFAQQNPDSICLELQQAPHSDPAAKTDESHLPLDWELHFSVPAHSLHNFDPLPVVLLIVMEYPGLTALRSQISTILSELYCNALEHGVLALNSELKTSHKGFSKYYQLKTEKLSQVKEGFISLSISLKPEAVGGRLIFEIQDSGNGFDHQKHSDEFKRNESYSGRGLPLLFELCESVEFIGKGNHVKAVYRWR
jgi:hypothetical protein